MDPLTIAAAAGMRARLESLSLVANNLSNTSAPGFKADRERFSLYLSEETKSAQQDGGWQQNYENRLHEKYRFVENIFEELDAPGEWFLDEQGSTLYYYPPEGLDLQH